MAPPRRGSAFEKRGVILVQVRLRAGAGKKFWSARCPPRADGVAVDLVHARAVAADLQRLYDAGKWDPLAPTAAPGTPDAATVALNPGAVPTVAEFALAWVAKQTYESQPKDQMLFVRHLSPSPMGSLAVSDVRPRHVVAYITWLKTRASQRGGTLAPRTIRNVYDAVRRALDAAVVSELLASNPCAALHGHLPEIVDKDPEARDTWFCTRDEVFALMTDPRVNDARRVVYAVEFLTGCRPGELAALRWRDWDRAMRPLTRLTIGRAVKSVSKKIGSTKTGARKRAPVHPFLERVLDAWWREGWRELMGRAPTLDDLLVPNQDGQPRSNQRANVLWKRDLVKLGLRERHHYCTRHTFISQTQDDGADGQILKWMTHAPPSSAFDGYTRTQWSRLCQELSKLRVGNDTAEDTTEAVPSVDAELVREAPVARVVDVRPIVVRALPVAVSPSLTAPLTALKAKSPGNRFVSGALHLSGREDLNLRLPGPEPGALPDCATPRMGERCVVDPPAAVKLFSRNSHTAYTSG